MCDESACRDTCLKWASLGTAGGALLGAAVLYDVIRAAAPVLRDVLLGAGVAAAAAVGAAVVLGVLRLYRRRAVLSARLVRRVAVRSAIPAAGVPLAIATGAPLFVPVTAIVGLVVVAGVVRRVATTPSVVYAHPALLAGQRREVLQRSNVAPLAIGPVLTGVVVDHAREEA